MDEKIIVLSEVQLPFEGLEELGEELFTLKGGKNDGGSGCGCGCGCGCTGGPGCGCGCCY
ncbi:MAG: hypothetical protein LBH04_05580 [Tannerellaceae bacterium]|jgi:hypothetical protein|nr:hypothetical protein [Tannerellaceae bacterium]